MSVELLPEELGFRRPFTQEVTEVLKITNTNKTPIAFKVKTTAPKQYCVRPNSGVIPPDSNVEVQVLLQAMKEDPPPGARCRDKFLVQSAPITGTDDSNVTALWQDIEKTAKNTILEKKIRVHFLDAAGGTPNGAHNDQPTSFTSPAANFGTPAPGESKTSSEKAKSTSTDTAEATGIAGVAAAVTKAIPTSQEELQQQLADARAQISSLTSQLSDPQLRQRKVQEATEKVQTVVQQTNESGVPLQVVAALCLLSFLVAYLLF